MNRRFPLEVVMRVREIRERLARQELTQARSTHDLARRQRDAQWQELGLHHLPASSDPRTFTAAFLARQSLAAQVQALQVMTEARAADVQHAQAEWASREQQRAGVDRLRERHVREVAAGDAAKEQAQLDEVGLRHNDKDGEMQ